MNCIGSDLKKERMGALDVDFEFDVGMSECHHVKFELEAAEDMGVGGSYSCRRRGSISQEEVYRICPNGTLQHPSWRSGNP